MSGSCWSSFKFLHRTLEEKGLCPERFCCLMVHEMGFCNRAYNPVLFKVSSSPTSCHVHQWTCSISLYIYLLWLIPGPCTVLYLSAVADTTLQNGIWWCVCAERHSGIYHRHQCQGRSFVDFNGFPVKGAEPMSLLLLFLLLQCVFRQLTAISATARGHRNMDLFCGVTCQEKVLIIKSD